MLEYNHCISTVEYFKDFIIAAYTIIDDIYMEIIPKHIQNRMIYPAKTHDSPIWYTAKKNT